MTESKFEHAARHITQLKNLLNSDTKNYSKIERDNWKKGLVFWLSKLKEYLIEEEKMNWDELT